MERRLISLELLDRMDGEEGCGRPLSAPSCLHHTLHEAKICAGAFSSWPPPQRPSADQPEVFEVRSTETCIAAALRAAAQPIALSSQEKATYERAHSAQSHGELSVWPTELP